MPAAAPRSSPRRVAAIVALAAAIALAAGAVAYVVLGRGPEPGPAVDRYLAAWSRGDDAGAARATDRPGPARDALAASRAGLDGARVDARRRSLRRDGDRATAGVRVTWQVPGFGEFAYDATLRLVLRDDRWVVAFSPRAIHPRLTAGTRLGTAADRPDRGDLLDRDGRALVTERPVVDVALQTDRVRDPQASAERVAELIDDVDAGELARRVRDAGRGRFVPVITLRKAAYDDIEERLRDVPGISLAPSESPLAPSRDFGRAVLGAVGPVTAEQIEKDPKLAPGDQIGQYGLQAAFERRLAGSPGGRIVIRRSESGTERRTLLARKARDGRPLRTTLDLDVQAAAEAALGATKRNAALVAVQPSTGDVLAVANRPAGSSLNRAFTGLYPPGSTFKVVSTTALLRAGLDPSETVACPRTTVVDGRSFRNFEGGAAGEVPFRTDFAESCNTAFVSLADRLRPDALTRTARDFGLGERLALGLPAAEASVPAAEGATGRAAMMIGQDRIVTSPLAMAGVAATVAAGRWHAPRLVAADRRREGGELREAGTLRGLMRLVVETGTGTALAGVPGEVGGKSGTAEYGGGDPPPTHAWFIAYRGDVAAAVLVEGGRAGGEVAAPIAARFLARLPTG
jgi:cell division protein FtsI/penicillin-binding protein 2